MPILSIQQAANYASQAGFTGSSLYTIVAIAMCESELNTQPPDNMTNGSRDRGILQISALWHPEVIDACAYDPACAFREGYRISANGTNFSQWSTFLDGCASSKIGQVRNALAMTGTTTVSVSSATANNYPKGQCTWWASERYHTLTGYYVPWMGNANQWSGMAASSQGWQVSNTPVVPSIIVLQAGVQLADPNYGHVAVVESINANGTVHTSDQNWAGITYPNTTYVDFTPGNGVSFVYASGTGSTSTTAYAPQGGSNPLQVFSTSIQTVSEQAHTIINSVPGFAGICEALDMVEQFVPFTLPTAAQQDIQNATTPQDINIFGWNTGIPNPFGIPGQVQAAAQLPADSIQAILVFTTTNAMAFLVRATFVLIGLVMLWALMINLISTFIGSEGISGIAGIAAEALA